MALHDVRRPIQLTLALINASMHTLGFVLLIMLYKRGRRNIQVMYLANLSLSEGLMNYVRSVYCIIRLFPDTFQRTTYAYFWIPLRSGLYYMYFFTMFFLTLDRLLTVLFVVRFTLFWGKRKTMFLLISMWSLSIAITLICLGLHHFTGYDSQRNKITHFYIPSVLSVSFIVFAIIAYSVMFWKFASTPKATSTTPPQTNSSRLRLLHIFRHSKFVVPILLVSTFLILTVVPNLTHAILRFTKSRQWYSSPRAAPFKTYNWISIYLSDTADALIYIMVYPPVRKLLSKAIDACRRKCCIIDTRLSHTDVNTTISSDESLYPVDTSEIVNNNNHEQHSLKLQDNIPLLVFNEQEGEPDAPVESLASLTTKRYTANEE